MPKPETTTLAEARAMALRNEPLPEEFYINKFAEVRFKPGRNLVARLRRAEPEELWTGSDGLMTEAADAIERLQAELDGALHNRFFDQRDAYFDGVEDGKR